MITAMMLPSLLKIGVLIDYKIHYDFIVKILCINKDEPIAECNGKCYLSTQLKNVDKQEDNPASIPKIINLEILYCYFNNSIDFLKQPNAYSSNCVVPYDNEFYNSSFIPDIFHPPQLNLI